MSGDNKGGAQELATASDDPLRLMRSRGRMKSVLMTFLLVATAGCYTYVRVDPASVPTGERLRLVVTPDGARELNEAVGAESPVPAVEGTLDRRDERMLVVRVPVVARQPGRAAVEQLIRIPEAQVLSAERKELDEWATGALVAGAVGLGVGIVLLIMEAWGSSIDGPGDDIDILFSVPSSW